MTFDFNTAATLPNGADILDRRTVGEGQVVLARYYGAQPFVTWRVDQDGNAYWGHYHRELVDAAQDFRTRTE